MVSKEIFDIVQANKDKLDGAVIYSRDFEYHYFGFKTLERSYLLKVNGKPVERPQQMLMRVAVGIHGECFYGLNPIPYGGGGQYLRSQKMVGWG